MKKSVKNSSKLLLFLYGAGLAGSPVVDYSYVHRLFPSLTASGRRSLVSHLKNSHYLLVEDFESKKQLFITSHGKLFLEDQFPALSSRYNEWDGTWSMLVFMEGPPSDPHFRYLRQLLVETHAGQLSRGVYLYPKQFHSKVIEQFDFYRGSISVVTIDNWQFGDERSIIIPLFQLSDVKDSLSGVSKEVDELLGVLNGKKGSMMRKEESFALVFDRLASLLVFDIGIHFKYFPQVEGVKIILTRLCKLLLL